MKMNAFNFDANLIVGIDLVASIKCKNVQWPNMSEGVVKKIIIRSRTCNLLFIICIPNPCRYKKNIAHRRGVFVKSQIAA